MRQTSTVITREFPDCFTLSNLITDPKSCINKPQICAVQRSTVASIQLSLKKCAKLEKVFWCDGCGCKSCASRKWRLSFGLPTKSVTNLVDINVAFDYQAVSKYGEIMFVPKLLTF